MPYRSIILLCALGPLIASIPAAAAAPSPASQPSADAWPLYQRAIARVVDGHTAGIYSPAESVLIYAEYPPYPPQWHQLENSAYEFNATAFAKARAARSRDIANWPALQRDAAGRIDMSYINGCRALANEVADAALQEHLRGDDAAAIERFKDLLHLADLLDGPRDPKIIRSLVAIGVRAVAMSRMEVIIADVALTTDPADKKELQVATATDLIRQVFNVNDAAQRYENLFRKSQAEEQWTTAHRDRAVVQLHRAQMEMNLAAMSLACHLFRLDKHRWPATVEDVTTYLPARPRDAWGPMGYVVVRLDRPGAPERPLVYSRCDATGELFYPTNEPQYSWFPGVAPNHKQGGQFRDVSHWVPAHPNPAPTTQPLGE